MHKPRFHQPTPTFVRVNKFHQSNKPTLGETENPTIQGFPYLLMLSQYRQPSYLVGKGNHLKSPDGTAKEHRHLGIIVFLNSPGGRTTNNGSHKPAKTWAISYCT